VLLVLGGTPVQVAELVVGGLPLRSDAVEAQKVNEVLVRMTEVG
jgi:hypothetical protein